MSEATYPAIFGFSCRRRTEYSYQSVAVRDVHAQPVAGRDELVGPVRPHAEQHLELVPVGRQRRLADDAQRLADQVLVVRRDPDVRALRDERLETLHVARAHRVELLEGELGGST